MLLNRHPGGGRRSGGGSVRWAPRWMGPSSREREGRANKKALSLISCLERRFPLKETLINIISASKKQSPSLFFEPKIEVSGRCAADCGREKLEAMPNTYVATPSPAPPRPLERDTGGGGGGGDDRQRGEKIRGARKREEEEEA